MVDNTSSVMQNQDFQIQLQKLNVAQSNYYIYMLKKMCIMLTLYDSWSIEKNTGNACYYQAPVRMKPTMAPIFGAQNQGFLKVSQVSFKLQLALYSNSVAMSRIAYDTISGPGGLAQQKAYIFDQQLTSMNEGMENIALESFLASTKNSFVANPAPTTGAIGVYDSATALQNYLYFRGNDVTFYLGQIINSSRDIATKGRVLQSYANVCSYAMSGMFYEDPEFKSTEDYGELSMAFTYAEIGGYKKMRYLQSTNTTVQSNSGGVYPVLSFGAQYGIRGTLSGYGSGGVGQLPKDAGAMIDLEFMKQNATPLNCTHSEQQYDKPTVENPDMATKYISNFQTYLGFTLLYSETSASVKTRIA